MAKIISREIKYSKIFENETFLHETFTLYGILLLEYGIDQPHVSLQCFAYRSATCESTMLCL